MVIESMKNERVVFDMELILHAVYGIMYLKFKFLKACLLQMFLKTNLTFLSFSQDDALRTAKVALVRARLRRQCFQSRKSHKANHSQYRNYNSATLSLIQAARDQPQASVIALQEILQKQSPPIDRFVYILLWFKYDMYLYS